MESARNPCITRICKEAEAIIHDGQTAQEKFISIMLAGFTQEEIDSMKQHNDDALTLNPSVRV